MSLLPTLSAAVPPPVLSSGVAVGACSAFMLSYVGGLYLSQATRVGGAEAKDADGRPLSKDDACVIRARLKVASWSTLVSLVGTGALLVYKRAVPVESSALFTVLHVLRLLGLPLPSPSLLSSSLVPTAPPLPEFLLGIGKAAVYPLLLTTTLYAGPLYVSYLDKELPGQAAFDYVRDVKSKWSTLVGIRNFIVGPATEELVFRSCILSVMYYSGASRIAMIFASPLYFGIAHLHHAWGTYVSGGRTKQALRRGLFQAAFQFLYTGLFGWYANFLFMRTGTILGPLLSHIFCNIMGLPNPFQAAQWHPQKSFGIYLSHVGGILAFAQLLGRLTRPALFGGSLYWS
ncbi:CAAX prenyl protease [Thecaphora frezii]